MGIYWIKKKKIIERGWRHHLDPPPPHPLPGVHNSQPILSKNSHPLQGSRRVDTWRKWIQQFLHTKYNWPVRFLLVNTLFSITWVVAEKGKGDKSLVPRNENLKKKSGMGIPNLVTSHTDNKVCSNTGHCESSNNNDNRVIVMGAEKEGGLIRCTVGWLIQNTIRSWCREPCGCWEWSASLQKKN